MSDVGPTSSGGWISRERVRLYLRVACAAFFLWLAFRLAIPNDGTGLLAAMLASWTVSPRVAAGWFLVGSCAYGVATAAAALRYLILLRGSGLNPDWRSVLHAYLFANFVGMLLPSGVMGDAYRFVDARRDTGRGVEVLSALVVERLLGLASLCAVGLMAAPFVPSLGTPSDTGMDSKADLAWCTTLRVDSEWRTLNP